jgi:uncharacterized YccA/Bax inhibitor family protein
MKGCVNTARARSEPSEPVIALTWAPGESTVTTSNPAFSQDVWAGYEQVYGAPRSTTMTVQGTVGKTFALLAILAVTAAWSWNATASGSISYGVVAVSALAGFIFAMITIFKPTASPITAPIYAALEGVFLGAVSQVVELRYGDRVPGIAMQAVSLTCGVMFIMLFVYATRLIRVTAKLQMGIVVATSALALFYLVSMLLRLFGMEVPLIWSSSLYGIGFSLFVVGLAAFNLLLDFDFIEKAAHREAPKYMEWYGAFGLMVTLVWLYLEILRLLQKLADRR